LMPFYFRKECPLNSGYLSHRPNHPSRLAPLTIHG
ncbi:2-hydroxy-6-oxononadienedioate/2-hydroxy-6-oxononatrienedioate hydrolase, partial [Escherichia coli]